MAGLTFTALQFNGGEERVLVPILHQELVSYMPSFPVVTVNLRRIKYQRCLADSRLKVVYGFIRDETSLEEHIYPSQIVVTLSETDSCYVDVSQQ